MSNFQINILTFKHSKPVTLPFFKVKTSENQTSLERGEIPNEVYDELDDNQKAKIRNIYTDFTTTENPDYLLSIDLTRSTRFARHYYNHLIREYFREQAAFVSENYIKDVEVWFLNDEQSTASYNAYNVYTLKIQMARLSESPEIVIYENGVSRISTTTVLELEDIDDEIIKTVVYEGRLYKYHDHNFLRAHLDKIYPMLNNPLSSILGIAPLPRRSGNKYKRIYDEIHSFVSNYLNNDEFKSIINLDSTDLITVPDNKVFKTHYKSSFINLGIDEKDKVSVLTPKNNLKEFGPYSIPDKPVKFIMIFHEADKDYANKLHMVFNRLYRRPNGKMMTDHYGTSLFEYIRVKYDLDKKHSISYKNIDNPHPQIDDFLNENTIDSDNYNYVAIYLSPIGKEEDDPEKHKVYYQVKKTLLFHNITSQAIFRDNLDNPNFRKFYYQNIAAAILAKTGGTPWKLASKPNNELVVGIGAFKSRKFDVQYIGSAFCFSNNGDFQEFNCVAKHKADLLAHEIKQYLTSYIEAHGTPSRLVIHYYKKISREEIEPINKMIYQLGFGNIPVIVITINKTLSKDYIVFDKDEPEELIPPSGTIINHSKHQYLLFNNTRYLFEEDVTDEALVIDEEQEIESYHLPLKLSFWSNKNDTFKDVAVVKELIDQIYQFSRMYWKSVKQQNLPVTIKYPEMVAKMFPYFELEEIPEFGRTNMWFL
jgi:hypothetical protein